MTDWDQRQLCPDGACVGLIGADGTCKVCGRAAPNWGDERKRGLLADSAENDETSRKTAGADADGDDEDIDATRARRDDSDDSDVDSDDADDSDDDDDLDSVGEDDEFDDDDDDGDDDDDSDEDDGDDDGDEGEAEEDESGVQNAKSLTDGARDGVATDAAAGFASTKKPSGGMAAYGNLSQTAKSASAGVALGAGADLVAASGSKPKAKKRTDWTERKLCPDGACIGVIGDNGFCKVCGKAVP